MEREALGGWSRMQLLSLALVIPFLPLRPSLQWDPQSL